MMSEDSPDIVNSKRKNHVSQMSIKAFDKVKPYIAQFKFVLEQAGQCATGLYPVQVWVATALSASKGKLIPLPQVMQP